MQDSRQFRQRLVGVVERVQLHRGSSSPKRRELSSGGPGLAIVGPPGGAGWHSSVGRCGRTSARAEVGKDVEVVVPVGLVRAALARLPQPHRLAAHANELADLVKADARPQTDRAPPRRRGQPPLNPLPPSQTTLLRRTRTATNRCSGRYGKRIHARTRPRDRSPSTTR